MSELTMVGNGCNERVILNVAKSLEGLVGRGKDGFVAALESAKELLRVVANRIGEGREVVSTEGAQETLGEGSSVVLLGKGTSGGREGEGESSKELHFWWES